jgi:hypothetical protein
MKKWYNKEQFTCSKCGHRWILISDKEIINPIHKAWLLKSLLQHAYIKLFPEGGFNEKK